MFALPLLFAAALAPWGVEAKAGAGLNIGANVAYMESLERSGLITRGPPLKAAPAAPVDPWKTPSTRGVAYIPSTARNYIAMWADYDHATVVRELGFAAAATANTVRVSLPWPNFAVAAPAFLASISDFVAAADAAGLKTVFGLFDGQGADPGGDASSLITSGAYKTAGWIASPGQSQVGNASALPALDEFVDALTGVYGSDSRVVGWDVFIQPILCNPCPTHDFLDHFLDRVSAAVRAGWVTTSVIPGAEACDSLNVPSTGRTLVAFENYNGNPGAVGGDTCGVQSCAASLAPNMPVLLSGSMGRMENPPSALCEILFECSGVAWIDIPAHSPIGYIIPFLMIGVDDFTANANQGLIWPNGTWYSAQEQACFEAPTPPVPPPPPPPPPPAVNFTTPDGLSVGLRKTTRAVQVLGLVNDTRWFHNFSFVPPLWSFEPAKPHRDFPGNHHLGDVTFRVQPASVTNASSWAFYSTAQGGDDTPAVPLPNPNPALIYDISNLTDAAGVTGLDTRYPLGLQVMRSVEKAPNGVGFAIRWTLSVPPSGSAVRVGGLGFSMVSDTFFGGINNTEIAYTGSFLDTSPGLGAGFVTYTRADGSRSLIVTPCSGDPAGAAAGLEAWRPLLEDATQPGEGIYEWTVHSAAWASEWAINAQSPELSFPNDPLHQAAWPNPRSPWPSWHLAETVVTPSPPRPWNPPSSVVIAPGASASYALCFSLPPQAADPTGNGGPRARDAGLAAAGRAVLIGVPGTVITNDTGASMFVLPPAGTTLLSAATDDPAVMTVGVPLPAAGGYMRIPVAGVSGSRGRARLTLNFSDGSVGSAHYYVLPPLQALSSSYGAFAASTSWLPRETVDPFGRSASFMPWDREDGVHVLQDGRPFVVGLSDDAGAGANLGMASKLAAAPHAAQLVLLDQYVNATLLGVKADTATPPLFSLQDPATWRIFMTVWYYDHAGLNTTSYYQETDKCKIGPSWCAFNSPWCNPEWCALPPQAGGWAPATYRQYNFPHQIATYWSLYLAAANTNLPTVMPKEFYLNAAAQSIYAANCLRPDGGFDCMISVGLMDGTVFREVLRALLSEGAAWASAAAMVNAIQYNRTFGGGSIAGGGWNAMDNPAGSEFSWDTTGQEEVSIWGAYFNATDDGWMHGELNARTVDSILGYMPSVPTWVYNGAALGFCDFSNNAKWMVTGGCEREGGHYRAGLNSIPVIERYRAHPDDFTLLQVGIGGIMTVLPNIDEDGAPSMAFHTHPFIMEHDPNSGDHGLGFFGSSLNAGSYLHNHATLGMLCFMCEIVNATASSTTIVPRDTYHIRAFLSPVGLWAVAEAGLLASVTLDTSARTIAIVFASGSTAAASAGTTSAPYDTLRLRVEQAAPTSRPFSFTLTSPAGAPLVRGAYAFAPAGSGTTTAVLSY